MRVQFPPQNLADAFIAYRNYLEDLARTVREKYGTGDTCVRGVHDAVLAQDQVQRLQRRQVDPVRHPILGKRLRACWHQLRIMRAEVDDPDGYDDEANATLPILAYFAAFHGSLAVTAASNEPVPTDHNAALRAISTHATAGRFPYPWSASCSGCPQLSMATFAGFPFVPTGRVNPLTSPGPATSEERFATLLRTTREKELERRFAEARRRGVAAGASRRNLRRKEKERLATSLAPTTLFDVLWRLRKKASYDDAEVFVLGAASEHDAWRFADAVVTVADTTVAALEALVVAYLGPDVVAETLAAYIRRCGAGRAACLEARHTSIASRCRRNRTSRWRC